MNDMCKVCVFYGEGLANYAFPGGHPFRRGRVEAFWNLFIGRGLKENRNIRVCEPVLADRDLILSFHGPNYVKFVEKSSKIGFGTLDYGDTPAFKGVFEAASYVVGSTLRGLDMVMNEEVDHAFNPVGGLHHARRDSAGGFCVFNDAAISIVRAKTAYKLERIAYVDIDAHHGDGVFYEFYDDPAVYNVDIHEDGRHLYPGTGFESERGAGEALGRKLNIPLPPGSGDKEFMEAFAKIEEFLEKAEPELILFQCGADGLAGDPLTHLRYTSQAHRYASRSLHRLAHKLCEGRIVAMGGGGYDFDNVAEAWVEVVKSLLGEAEL